MNHYALLLVEGSTEEAFYRNVLSQLRNINNSSFDKIRIKIKNLKGVGNYKRDAVNSLKRYIISEKIKDDDTTTVFLCYDKDVFSQPSKIPPVNMRNVANALKAAGATKVISIVASASIEDWFIVDRQGLKKYFGSKIPDKELVGIGQEIIKNLMKKYKHTVYIKGQRVEGFLSKLDIRTIMGSNCRDIKPLCKTLHIRCHGNGICEKK